MTEEEFAQAEELRVQTERKKESQKAGMPEEVTVEKQVSEKLREFFQVKLDNAGFREYIKREHNEFHSILETYVNLMQSLLEKQLATEKSFNEEVLDRLSRIESQIVEHIDNSNLVWNKFLELQQQKNNRLFKTCDIIDAELKP